MQKRKNKQSLTFNHRLLVSVKKSVRTILSLALKSQTTKPNLNEQLTRTNALRATEGMNTEGQPRLFNVPLPRLPDLTLQASPTV